MTTTITRYGLGLIAGCIFVLLSPLAQAEGLNNAFDDVRAESKIDLVTDMAEELGNIIDEGDAENIDTTKAFVDLETGLNSLADAEMLFSDAQYDDAYDAASDAFGVFDRAINSVRSTIDKQITAEMKEREQIRVEIQTKCESSTIDENTGDCIKQSTEELSTVCTTDNHDADYFCRDGALKDKKDAQLTDVMNGFIKAADLTDEQATLIRQEVETLIRQLIVRIMGILQ